MRYETSCELRFSELETRAGAKPQADSELSGCQWICVGQGKVVLRLLLRRKLQQAGGTELGWKVSVEVKAICWK